MLHRIASIKTPLIYNTSKNHYKECFKKQKKFVWHIIEPPLMSRIIWICLYRCSQPFCQQSKIRNLFRLTLFDLNILSYDKKDWQFLTKLLHCVLFIIDIVILKRFFVVCSICCCCCCSVFFVHKKVSKPTDQKTWLY